MSRKFFSGPFILILPSILAIGFVIIIPLIFSFYTSFTSYKLTRPDSLFNFVGLRNYERLIDNTKFWYAFGRTILFLAVVLNLELLFGLGIALLINKITWGQRTLRTIMMFPMMFSPILVGFQWKYIFNDNIGLLNNLYGLIFLHSTFMLPLGVFMMRNAFISIPSSLREVAILEGTSELQIILRVLLPLCIPGLLTVMVFAMYVSWNDYIFAYVFVTTGEREVLNVALAKIALGGNEFDMKWGSITAGSVISFIPIIIFYTFLQQYFVRGVTGSAVKE